MFLTQGQSGGQEKHQDIPRMHWSLTKKGQGDSHFLEGKLDTKLQRLWCLMSVDYSDQTQWDPLSSVYFNCRPKLSTTGIHRSPQVHIGTCEHARRTLRFHCFQQQPTFLSSLEAFDFKYRKRLVASVQDEGC